MIKIGITGGIGCGKSVIATLLKLHRIPVYIADTESKILVETSPAIKKKLTALFGNEIYRAGHLDRTLLASHIFGNPESLKQVNAIIHPEVQRHFDNWCKNQDTNVAAMESAILFESGFNRIVDIRLMVYAPLDLRIRRASIRENVSREIIEKRIRNQWDDEKKKSLSDYVIYNDDRQALIPQVNKFLETTNRIMRL